MRQIELNVLPEDCIETLASGELLQLTVDGIVVAEIVPSNLVALAERQRSREESRQEAIVELRRIMDHGYDLGIVWNGRDELYDRD